ncbi:hypothetical protein LUZ60_003366 [Juncus effusus]|nr:hypothetical protein LUZ60_003366 [Juncus effusus]
MDSDETFSFQTPSRVAVTRRSSPFIRRLSSRRTEPSLQACVARRRKLSWVTLQGRLIGVDEATSAQYVGPGLSREEAVAWELFSPLQRVLLVALVAAAEAKSKAFQKIKMLQRSVDLRDEILRNMQLKLECLSEEMNTIQDQSIKYSNLFISQKSDLTDENKGIITEIKQEEQNEKENERYFTNLVEQEERRMSDLSDFCWSVASSFDNNNQLNCEKEIYNLQKECNEKDEKIKELLSSAKLSTISDSKLDFRFDSYQVQLGLDRFKLHVRLLSIRERHQSMQKPF